MTGQQALGVYNIYAAKRVADELRHNPGISASELARRLRARKADVVLIVRTLRAANKPPTDGPSAVLPGSHNRGTA